MFVDRAFLRRIPLAVGMVFAGLSAEASASPTFFNLRVSASACDITLDSDRSKVELVEGSWRFTSSGSGEVTLICPVHVQYYGSSVFSSNMVQMRVWYYDPSGSGTASHVKAQLKRRHRTNGHSSVGSEFNSNTEGSSEETRAWHTLNHTMSSNYMYYVDVKISRSTTATATPRFTGIDWWSAPSFTP